MWGEGGRIRTTQWFKLNGGKRREAKVKEIRKWGGFLLSCALKCIVSWCHLTEFIYSGKLRRNILTFSDKFRRK